MRHKSSCTIFSYSSCKSYSISNQELCDQELVGRLDTVALNMIETNQTNQFKMIKNNNGEVVQIVSSRPKNFIKNEDQQQNSTMVMSLQINQIKLPNKPIYLTRIQLQNIFITIKIQRKSILIE